MEILWFLTINIYDNILRRGIFMKKILILFIVLIVGLSAFASEQQEALQFFNDFVQASNTYNPGLLNMYSNNAKIIRQVVKPNGQLVNAYFTIDQYKSQMRLSSKLAKIRNYKNYYSNINVTKVANGYKIDSMRKPSLSDYKLKSSMIVQKQSSGKWLITEELMQTKEQIFLKYAK